MTDATEVQTAEGAKPPVRYSESTVQMEVLGGGAMLLPETLGEVVEFSGLMSKAGVAVPAHLRGNQGTCLSVCMQAFRWEMDPFAVANKSYSVNDRMGYEAQLIAAVIHTRAPIRSRPLYEYEGEGEMRSCRVTCVMRDGEKRDYISPALGKIGPRNSPLWKTDPDQQLGYYSIRAWARRHVPEVILGVYDPEELAYMRDVTPRQRSGVAERLELHGNLSDPGFRDGHVDETLDRPLDEATVEAIATNASSGPTQRKTRGKKPLPSLEEPSDTKASATDASGASAEASSGQPASSEPTSAGVEGEQSQGETSKSPATSGDSPADTDDEEAITLENLAIEFTQGVASDTSWLSIRPRVLAIRKEPSFQHASRQRRKEILLVAFERAIEINDPVKATEDPGFFRLWLLQAAKEDIRPAFRSLSRSQGYSKLNDEQKALVGEETAQAEAEQ